MFLSLLFLDFVVFAMGCASKAARHGTGALKVVRHEICTNTTLQAKEIIDFPDTMTKKVSINFTRSKSPHKVVVLIQQQGAPETWAPLEPGPIKVTANAEIPPLAFQLQDGAGR